MSVEPEICLVYMRSEDIYWSLPIFCVRVQVNELQPRVYTDRAYGYVHIEYIDVFSSGAAGNRCTKFDLILSTCDRWRSKLSTRVTPVVPDESTYLYFSVCTMWPEALCNFVRICGVSWHYSCLLWFSWFFFCLHLFLLVVMVIYSILYFNSAQSASLYVCLLIWSIWNVSWTC